MLLLQLFVAVSLGRGDVFGGQAVGGSKPCSMVLAEDDLDTIAWRLQNITAEPLPDEGVIIPLPNVGPHQLLASEYPGGPPTPTDFFRMLDQELTAQSAIYGKLGFLALDPFAVLFGVDENSSREVQAVWAHLTHLAEKHDICIIVTHHLRKGASQDRASIRGSTALVDGARAAYVVTREGNPNETLRLLNRPTDTGLGVIHLSLVKDNLGLRSGRITMVRELDGTLTDVTNRMQAWLSPEDAILKVLADLNAKGQRVTKSGQDGIYHFRSADHPKIFQNMGRDPMIRTVQALIDRGRIINDREQGLIVSEAIPG
jgi:hypothetical protein